MLKKKLEQKNTLKIPKGGTHARTNLFNDKHVLFDGEAEAVPAGLDQLNLPADLLRPSTHPFSVGCQVLTGLRNLQKIIVQYFEIINTGCLYKFTCS